MKALGGVLAGVLLAAIVPLACTSHKDEPTNATREELLDPQTCATCHADHYREWSGSMHAYAADDPVFLAMNKRGQRETNGQLGTFCVKCHAPMAVREGATTDGLNLAALPAKLKGVTCFFCHTIDAVQGTHDAMLHGSDDLIMRGAYSDPVANAKHRAGYSALHDRDKLDSANMCGTCHDIVSPAGAPIERTLQEWNESVFSHAPGGTTCGQCHMAQSANLEPIAQAPGVFSRRRHAHTFAAIDRALTPFAETDAQKSAVQALLDTSLQSALCVSVAGPPEIRVLLDNVAAGHAWPSGASQDRRAWVEVVAYAGSNVVYQSGVVADGSPVVKLDDPDLWLLRDCMFDASGTEVHMFWQAATTEGNELVAQATFDATDPRYYKTHIVQSYPRSGAAIAQAVDRVTMRVRIQPMGLDVLDDLVASGDLDPGLRNAMPTYDVGQPLEWTPSTAADGYSDENRVTFKCVSKTAFKVAADKVPAVAKKRCK
jgi:hypothetical protein